MAYLAYDGPSMLDGKPIFAALSGLENPSRNMKTGPMLQLWIMRKDMNPLEATRAGADSSVCGECPLMGVGGKSRTCYVNLARSPLTIYKTLQTMQPMVKSWYRNRAVRLGAYGDPAALPIDLIADIYRRASLVTGYTHQWKSCDQGMKKYLMASCDSEEDRLAAKALGWATFRVKLPSSPRLAGEKVCPASAESGKKLNCISCGLCRGGDTKDIVINVHGMGVRHFYNLETT